MAKKRKAAAASKPSRRKAIAATDELESELPADEAEPKGEDKAEASSGEDVHAEVLERYQSGWTKDRDNQNEGYVDLKFLADTEEGGQWDDTARKARVAAAAPSSVANSRRLIIRSPRRRGRAASVGLPAQVFWLS